MNPKTLELSDWKDGFPSFEMRETLGRANLKGKIKISVLEVIGFETLSSQLIVVVSWAV